MKFTNPQQPIILTNKLKLRTTIPFNLSTKSYEKKQAEIDMALEIDGQKAKMQEKVNLADAVTGKLRNGVFTK